jgi:hypothetical protein
MLHVLRTVGLRPEQTERQIGEFTVKIGDCPATVRDHKTLIHGLFVWKARA